MLSHLMALMWPFKWDLQECFLFETCLSGHKGIWIAATDFISNLT